MSEKISFHRRINVRILTVMLVLFALTAAVVSISTRSIIRRLYEDSFTERVLLSNALIANIIDSNDISYFVDLMTNQDEAFKQRQLQFFHTREELFRLQEAGASEQDQQVLLTQLDAFHKEMEVFKTDYYWKTVADLRQLREVSHCAYAYVMAYTGLTAEDGEKLYTYILDADDVPVYDSPDIDGLGTCNIGEEVLKRIYETKKQMDYVEYYQGDYGELYFAYAPILNENGDVIAILGTDVDLGGMNEAISSSILTYNSIFLAAIVIIILIIFLFLSRSIINPLGSLTNTAYELAEGNVYAQTSESALRQRTEIGMLAHAVNNMSLAYQVMINSTAKLFAAATIGKLDIRNDTDEFKGDIQNVMQQINETLDSITLYLDSIPEGIFIMSKDFEIYFRNKHYAQCLGDLSALAFLSYVLAPETAKVTETAEIPEIYKDRLAEELEDGYSSTSVWIEDSCYTVSIREIALNDTVENSVLVIVSDITDLMKEKEKAQAAAEAKSSFLSRMSHEMRTPMNAIIGMTRIAEDTSDVTKLKYCLSTIGTSSEQLLGIINDVLDMAKIEAGKLELENVEMNLEKMLTNVCDIIADNIEKKNQKFNVTFGEGLELNYIADNLRLSQVVTNLLSNAVKYTPENGSITLSVEKTGRSDNTNELLFSVADTGIGMTSEQISRLFTSFEQADGSITRKFGGTGLGLAISKSIVEKMGGRIWVESEFGAGSKFSFVVNLELSSRRDADDPYETCTADTYVTPDLSGVTIILAEDVDINREIFAALLDETNISIDSAENGLVAISMFKENPDKYDLIVMDVQMPEMDGFQATRAIRAMDIPKAKTIPIIAMTANAFKEDVERCLESGMNDHLAKPIDEKAVIEKILLYLKKQGA